MFCTQCGTPNADTAQICANCGKSLQPVNASPAIAQPTFAAPPSSASYGAAAYGVAPAPFVQPTPTEQRTDGKAIGSLVCGILSLTIFWFFAAIPAIILGHISRSAIRKSMGRLKGEGIALAGLIMGYVSVAALPFILIIAAIAIPNLMRARTAANEASAVGSIRTINSAVVTYYSMYGKGFPERLEQLGTGPAASEPTADHAGLIDESLTMGRKHGYRFVYAHTETGYFVAAVPDSPGAGARSFCTDESALIRYATRGEECTPASQVLSD